MNYFAGPDVWINIEDRISKSGDSDVCRALRGRICDADPLQGKRSHQGLGLRVVKTKWYAKARVAVTRKLAVIMHAMWSDGTFYVVDCAASRSYPPSALIARIAGCWGRIDEQRNGN